MGRFNWILILFLPNLVAASLKNAKIHPDLPLVELKQHRHNMDQLEPDLAQTIFDGVQRNPLERTTTVKPLKNIRSPTLRGKRGAAMAIKMADVRIMDDGPDDGNSSAIETGNVSNQTFVIEERLNLEVATNDTVVDEEHEVFASEAVIGSTSTAILEKDEAFEILTSGSQTPADSTLTTSEALNLTESAEPTTLATTAAAVVETSAVTGSEAINFTQNDNLPTANLDRKILAFEVDFHNKKILAEKLQKKQLLEANRENPSEDLGLSNAENDEEKTHIWESAPALNVHDSNSAEVPLVLPRRKILDSTVQKRRRIISNFVPLNSQNGEHKVLKRTKRELTKKLLKEILAAKVLNDDPTESHSDEKLATKSAEKLSPPPADVPALPSAADLPLPVTTTEAVHVRHLVANEITKPPTTTTTTTTTTTVPTTTTTTTEKPTTKSFPTSWAEKLKLLEETGSRNGIVLGLVKVTSTPPNEVDFSAESEEDDGNPWKNKYKSHIQIHLTDESREVVERSDLKILPKLVPVNKLKESKEKSLEFRDLPDPKDVSIVKDSEVVKATRKAVSGNVGKSTIDASLPDPTTIPPAVTVPATVQPLPQIPQVVQPQRFVPFQSSLPAITLNHFVIDGRRFIVPSIPENSAVFWTPPPFQPQFFRPPAPIAAPIPRTVAPVIEAMPASTGPASSRKIVHAGRAQSNAAPSDLVSVKRGERLREEEINFVRIFDQAGTTKHAFAPPTTTPTTTTSSNTPATTTTTTSTTTTTAAPTTTASTTVEVTTTVPTTTVTTSEKPTTTTTAVATEQSTTTTATTTPESEVREHDPPPIDVPNLEDVAVKTPTKRPNLKLVRLGKVVNVDAFKAKPARDFVGDAPKAKPDLEGFGNRFLAAHG